MPRLDFTAPPQRRRVRVAHIFQFDTKDSGGRRKRV